MVRAVRTRRLAIKVQRFFAIGFLLLILAGCNTVPVANDIDQNQANQIVALLNSRGISAISSKEAGSSGRFSVEVGQDLYSQAVSLLYEKGLPRPPAPSFSELTSPQGFLPNSREVEALRLDHALAGELETLLENHPGVGSARVIVRSHSHGENNGHGVSVVIQQRGHKIPDDAKLREIITRAVPGVKNENITLLIEPSVDDETVSMNEGVQNVEGKVLRVPLVPFLLGWRIPEEDYNGLALTLLSCFVVMIVVGGVIGYWFGLYQKSNASYETELLEPTIKSLRIDRSKRDSTEI